MEGVPELGFIIVQVPEIGFIIIVETITRTSFSAPVVIEIHAYTYTYILQLVMSII